MKLSNFGLCKPFDDTYLPAINANEILDDDNLNVTVDVGGCFPEFGSRCGKSPLEQLQHWQINRRKLAYSTIGKTLIILLQNCCGRKAMEWSVTGGHLVL